MNKQREIVLSPAQQRALDELLGGISAGNVLLLKGCAGSGRTIVLQKLAEAAGGVLLGMRQFMESLAGGPPAAIEEAFLQMIEGALAQADIVIVDDLHLVVQVAEACDYPRSYLLDAAVTAILGEAAALGKKLVFGTDGNTLWPLARRAYTCQIAEFQPEDYASICGGRLAEAAGELDYARVHRFAPALTAQQLSNACNWLGQSKSLDTDTFIEYLRSHYMASNVELEEVAPVSWSDLKGVDNVIQELEAKVALPFENDALRVELGLKAKRGVLLAGPPGTGKTTIGRALAHRLKSKFFLIDGTVVAGSNNFYRKVGEVFEAAKRNAPAIVFIDDADVIFQDEDNRGFYRYLLTILDGLESASAERVCVMLTAMHPGSLPEAMVRSGRVELWLETALPDAAARAAILREKVTLLPPPLGCAGVEKLASASHGLTGADLKNVVEDAKLLFAHDRSRGNPAAPSDEYFFRAIESVRGNRRKYANSRPPKLAERAEVGFVGG